MTIAAAIFGSLFFGSFTAGMMFVVWAGLVLAYRGPTWKARAQGLALVITIVMVIMPCLYAIHWMWTAGQQMPVFP